MHLVSWFLTCLTCFQLLTVAGELYRQSLIDIEDSHGQKQKHLLCNLVEDECFLTSSLVVMTFLSISFFAFFLTMFSLPPLIFLLLLVFLFH